MGCKLIQKATGKTDLKSSEDDIFISVTNNSICGLFPMPDGKWRIDGTISKELKQKETLTFENVEEHFSEINRIDTKLYAPEWLSVFHSRQHHAATFRKERCFLIGDAAHIHSPVGAQGMNTGLQDAYNLSWKLAFVLKKKSDVALSAVGGSNFKLMTALALARVATRSIITFHGSVEPSSGSTRVTYSSTPWSPLRAARNAK